MNNIPDKLNTVWLKKGIIITYEFTVLLLNNLSNQREYDSQKHSSMEMWSKIKISAISRLDKYVYMYKSTCIKPSQIFYYRSLAIKSKLNILN